MCAKNDIIFIHFQGLFFFLVVKARKQVVVFLSGAPAVNSVKVKHQVPATPKTKTRSLSPHSELTCCPSISLNSCTRSKRKQM